MKKIISVLLVFVLAFTCVIPAFAEDTEHPTIYITGAQTNQLVDANGNSVGFYSSGSNQYSFLKQFEGQEVTVEVAACNWNNKTYWRGCVLAVRLADGSKILNELNFTTN